MELLIENRRPDKYQPSSGHNWSTIVIRARIRHSLGNQLRIGSKRDLPQILSGIQINRAQGAPRRRSCRVSVGIGEAAEGDGLIGHIVGFAAGTLGSYRVSRLSRPLRPLLL